MVKETAVNQVPGDDGGISILFGKMSLMDSGELELVATETGEFPVVVVPRVWSGEEHSGIRFDGEIEFGGQFEVDEMAGFEVFDQKIEFTEGGVNVALDLKVPFEKIPAG